MSNITFKADDEIIKKARKLAIEKNTTLTKMLTDYLAFVVKLEDEKQSVALTRLKKTFEITAETWARKGVAGRISMRDNFKYFWIQRLWFKPITGMNLKKWILPYRS